MTITRSHIQQWLDAGNSHDPLQLVSIMTPDFVMHQPQNPKPLGRNEVISFFAMLFAAFPNMYFKGEGSTIEGDEAASWERVTGTMTGPYTDPATGEVIAPTGKSFDLHAAMHLRYDASGKIKEVRIFWDRLDFMKQLGLLHS